MPGFVPLAPDLYAWEDTCRVYVLVADGRAVAIDFGAGEWLDHLDEIRVDRVDHVLITHAHRDQVSGLAERSGTFRLHVPGGDADYFDPPGLAAFRSSYQSAGCPANYAAPVSPPVTGVRSIGEASDLVSAGGRITAIPTPGHTVGALTYVTTWHGKQVAFCGDALTADGRIHEPYHLEWDHWTSAGARAALHGLTRLGEVAVDLLCPSHGDILHRGCRRAISKARTRLSAFVRAKGSVCEGERDRWHPVTQVDDRTVRVSDHVYLFGGNTYVLTDDAGAAMVIDPTLPSAADLPALLDRLGATAVTATTATHYHRDHSDGLNHVREVTGAPVWLHPWVAEPLVDRNRMDVPWLPAESVAPDRRLPERGTFRWSTYRFGIRPFPGQTRWHCAFDTAVDGRHVLFSGDNFQPPSRWNGTGGFCSFNRSTMDGFAESAQAAIDLDPDLVCNGHGCVYEYSARHYRKILAWTKRSQAALDDLSASAGGFDYGQRRCEPFRSVVKPGETARVSYCVTNSGKGTVRTTCEMRLPEGWSVRPARRGATVKAGQTKRMAFEVTAPKRTAEGRYLAAAEVTEDGRRLGQVAVGLIDVESKVESRMSKVQG